MLKDAAKNWVQTNCFDPKLRHDLSRQLADVLQRRVDCWFGVGEALTRSKAPFMIHCYAGELFFFQLTKAQAAGLRMAPNAMMGHSVPFPPTSCRANPVIVSISKLELDKPIVAANDAISGTFEYEIDGEPPTSWCARLNCLMGLGEDETSWCSPIHALGRSGQIRFSFESGRQVWPLGLMHGGPLPVFLRVYSDPCPGDESQRQPISNTCGALLDIDGYWPWQRGGDRRNRI